MVKITLTKGNVAFVDNEDYDYLSQWKWSWLSNRWGGYAVRVTRKKGQKQQMIYMHRLIMKATKDFEVDHINGNTLDNRRVNLRVCIREQNGKNMGRHKDSRSQYKGVRLTRGGRKWQARIWDGEREIFLGGYDTAEEAALVYNDAAKRLHGEYARLNILIL